MADLVGRDVYCSDSLRPGRTARGAILTGQRLYHALITPRGALLGGPDEESFGEDLEGLCGKQDAELEIESRVARAASKDETILSVETTVSRSEDTAGNVSYDVEIAAKTAEGPFRLVLAVGDVTVAMVGLSSEAA